MAMPLVLADTIYLMEECPGGIKAVIKFSEKKKQKTSEALRPSLK